MAGELTCGLLLVDMDMAGSASDLGRGSIKCFYAGPAHGIHAPYRNVGLTDEMLNQLAMLFDMLKTT